MLVEAKIAKILPVRSGSNDKGSWEYLPMVIEFEEQGATGPVVNAVCVELSTKNWDVKKLQELHASGGKSQFALMFNVRQGERGMFNDIKGWPTDSAFRKEREY